MWVYLHGCIHTRINIHANANANGTRTEKSKHSIDKTHCHFNTSIQFLLRLSLPRSATSLGAEPSRAARRDSHLCCSQMAFYAFPGWRFRLIALWLLGPSIFSFVIVILCVILFVSVLFLCYLVIFRRRIIEYLGVYIACGICLGVYVLMV